MMPTPNRNELVRCLADIDRCLAQAEAMADDPVDDGERQSALDFLIEFHDARRQVEAKLRKES
jgi:hypothetical protein